MTKIIRAYTPLPASTRIEMLIRDGYTCQDCGFQGKANDGTLDVHHILPYRSGGEHTPDNLITLCAPCHYKHDHAHRVDTIKERTKNPSLTAFSRQITTIRLPEQTKAKLDALCVKLGIPATQVIIRAIEAYARKFKV